MRGEGGERDCVPHQRFLAVVGFIASPIRIDAQSCGSPPLLLAVISPTHHDYLGRRHIWPPVTQPHLHGRLRLSPPASSLRSPGGQRTEHTLSRGGCLPPAVEETTTDAV